MSIVLTNAKIFTADKNNEWADTIVINNEKIEYVGKAADNLWKNYTDTTSTIRDMEGKMIIPGIIDSHVHPAMIAKCSWHTKLPLTYDVDEILAYIKKYAEEHPKEEKPFLYFEYYPSVIFDENGPRKELLDYAVSDRPCLVQDFGEHMAWVNSKMLEVLEVTKESQNPEEELRIFVSDEKGELTGFVKEMAWFDYAENMYRNIGWRPPVEMTPELIQPVMDFLLENGVTAMADGFIEDESELKALAQMEKEGRLNTYYDGYVRCDTFDELPDKLALAENYKKKYTNRHMKINTMKIFLDGTNESGNSYLIEPKSNDPTGTDYGNVSMSEDDLIKYLIYCNERDFDVHIHLVGDGSFRMCCNAMEEVKRILGEKWHVQLTLAHCELINPDDMKRPAELGITINWTPRWAGGCYGEQGKIYLGEERWKGMYQFNPIIDSGALVAFSSDVITYSKMERANPFYGMQIGHTRVDIADPLDPARFPGSVRPEESAKLSRDVLLYGSTINGATQLHWENIMGSLETGKLANLVVLSDDYFEVEPFEISKIKCEAVMFEGKILKGEL